MVKCVVSGCPNRTNNLYGNLDRAPKTFFSFPSDPRRVKVWLAALRETDKLVSTEQHLICEDHFLKEDITPKGVKSGAIPIMSPYLDGSIGTISSWEAENKTREEEGEKEEEDEDFCVVMDNDTAPTESSEPEPSSVDRPFKLDPSGAISSSPKDPDPVKTPWTQDPGSKQHMTEIMAASSDACRRLKGVSLPLRVLRLLQTLPGVSLECSHLVKMLQADRRRIHDISCVLEGINLVERQRNRVRWIGGSDHSPHMALQSLQSEVENLELMEEELDGLIRDVLQQLLEMSSDRQNAELAYVTLDDIRRLEAFEEQTVMVVKAPDETVLKVTEPSEDFIQIHVRSWNGPITMLTCDTGTQDRTAEGNCFLSLEESRMKTSSLHGEAITSSHPVMLIDATSSGDASVS
ncbi:transcription factor E2F6 [Halichoeres trimaculatus]|uniref:transcription factor E2F6 n=1 Tax=Halichoeres trimaculatus TaxID=147232 RepID=UPI003D9ECCDF